MRSRLFILVLVTSLAFNVGFAGAFAYNHYRSSHRRQPGCLPPSGEASPRFQELSARLQQELEPLRGRQAAETRRLAQLLDAAEPDRQEIARSLDRLAATGRLIHGLVVDTILEQREVLPASQRRLFCSHVRQRLCEPWVGCSAACDNVNHENQNDHGNHNNNDESDAYVHQQPKEDT